jgi:hypothetical protein
VPYNGKSDKITFSNKATSTDLLAVAPLVAIVHGGFRGVFPGQLRYTSRKPARAIGRLVLNLWLDYSEVIGKLHKIKVVEAGEVSNVSCRGRGEWGKRRQILLPVFEVAGNNHASYHAV